MAQLEGRLAGVEDILKETVWLQHRNEMAIQSLTRDMDTFKDEMRADRREMNKKWGDLANNMGTIVEDIIYPGFRGILRSSFDVEAEFLAQRIRVRHPKDRKRLREFDIIAFAGDQLFLNETKSYIRREYLEAFVANKEEIFDYLPHLRRQDAGAHFQLPKPTGGGGELPHQEPLLRDDDG